MYARDFFVFSLDLLLPLLISISFVYSVGVFVKVSVHVVHVINHLPFGAVFMYSNPSFYEL